MATTYDKASLVMIPSGVKEDKLYSIKPTDGSGDFTFSRGSDIQATRVNSSGLIEKAKVNLLTWSNNYDNWTKTDATATSGQTGYDGSSDAWLLTSTGTGNNTRRDVSYSGVSSFSVYAKAGTADGIRLRFDAATDRNLFVDLTDGSVITGVTTAFAYSVEPVAGTGWYRITATADLDTGINVRIIVIDGTGAGTTGTIYIQDAQLNNGIIAQDYVETTTTAVVEGLTADLPRLDYSGGASCPSLLLEPSRTNNATQSEYIGAWAQSETTGTDNFAVSPEGVQNASKVSASLTSANHFIQLTGGSVGNTATISLFAKADTGSYIQLTNPYSGAIFANFDVATGVVGTKGSNCISSDIEDYGNGWYRCIAVFDNTSFSSNIYRHYIVPSASATFGQSWLPASDTSLFIYGHSWEAGSYPTSYIPTYGTAAVRGKDEATNTSATNLIGQSEGTLFAEFDYLGNTSGALEISPLYIGTGTYQTAIYLDIYQGDIYGVIFNGGANQASINCGSLSVGRHKVAIAYKANDIVVYVDGVLGGSDTSATIPACSQVHLGEVGSSTSVQSYNQQQALLFKTRLTNAELESLTTI